MIKIALIILLILLNAKTELFAQQAIARHPAMAATAAPRGKSAHNAAKRLVVDVSEFHAPIAKFFVSDAGAGLMRRDSDLMRGLLTDLARSGVPALPVHDSVIVAKSAASRAEIAMLNAVHQAGVRGARVVAA